MENEFKPNKRVFLTFRFLKGSLILGVIFLIPALIFSLTIFSYAWLIVLLLFLVLRIYAFISLRVEYKKEVYLFQGNKIINKGGGLFSDYETELNIKNITNIEMILPLIEHWRFKTGHIRIQSAGSGATEVNMLSLDNPDAVYDKVAELMRNNGFNLNKDNLIQQESPHILGVIFESVQRFVATLFAMAFILVNFAGLTAVFFNKYFLFGLVLLVLALGAVFGWAIIVFLDLKNRIYRVYSNLITYDEGFLTKRYAFIPVENLADSSTTQNLVDRIFGLYDVIISSQGAGQEIKFKNMANGQELENNLDKLISSTKSLVGKKEESTMHEQTTVKKEIPKPSGDTTFTSEFQMDLMRTLAPTFILIPLFPIWIIIAISILIQVSATHYFVKPSSMEERFSFLSARSKEFTNDKITAIVFKEGILDRFFDTFSINFGSIGSAQDIKFKNIKKQEGLVDKIVAKSGVQPEEKIYEMQAHYSFGRMLKATLPFTIFFLFALTAGIVVSILFTPAVFIPILLVLIFVVSVIYKKFYYKRSRLTFYRNYIHFKKGIFFRTEYYVLYDNVKDITTVRYPFSSTGKIKFNVAGMHIEGQGNQQAAVSNSFTINYVENISSKDELVDIIFYQRPDAGSISQMENNIESYKPKVIQHTKPSVKNSLVPLVLISVIIFPFILLLPVTVPFTVWAVKVKSYRIEDYRVVARSGIMYKKQTSIVFSKIDHINTSQGLLNKLFKNGNVTVNTAGSTMPELTILNIPDFRKFYDNLNSYY